MWPNLNGPRLSSLSLCCCSGELRRTTAQHKLNRKSNRSHSIFSIYIQQKAKTGVNERVLTSKLNLVDLAGRTIS
jgi:kinesin family protein 6/9